MGVAIAKAAMLRGAEVTLVAAHMEAKPPMFVEVVPVKNAQDMFEAVTSRAADMDVIIKAAAVSDYTPASVADSKMKKKDGELSIELKRTQDILKYLGANKREGQFLCGFSMETDNVLENSRKKLLSKNCDMICANSLRHEGAGFGVDTNVITLITADSETELPQMSKEDAAHRIFDVILNK
jgi:phosphopantothenoylcysteine decarboxylase/phosphopantothenate--cysteine ligase